MSEKPKLVIFKNTREPKPEDQYKQSDYNGKITLPADLPAGEYSVGIYLGEYQDKKTGEIKKYMSGNIRPAVKKEKNFNARQFVEEAKSSHDEDDQEIPF